MSSNEKALWAGGVATVPALLIYLAVDGHPVFIAGFAAMALYFVYNAMQMRSERSSS